MAVTFDKLLAILPTLPDYALQKLQTTVTELLQQRQQRRCPSGRCGVRARPPLFSTLADSKGLSNISKPEQTNDAPA